MSSFTSFTPVMPGTGVATRVPLPSEESSNANSPSFGPLSVKPMRQPPAARVVTCTLSLNDSSSDSTAARIVAGSAL